MVRYFLFIGDDQRSKMSHWYCENCKVRVMVLPQSSGPRWLRVVPSLLDNETGNVYEDKNCLDQTLYWWQTLPLKRSPKGVYLNTNEFPILKKINKQKKDASI